MIRNNRMDTEPRSVSKCFHRFLTPVEVDEFRSCSRNVHTSWCWLWWISLPTRLALAHPVPLELQGAMEESEDDGFGAGSVDSDSAAARACSKVLPFARSWRGLATGTPVAAVKV